MILVDAHCHLEGADFEQSAEILRRAREAGVVHAVVVGQLQAPGDFGTAIQVAKANPGFLSPTMGIHPHEAANATPADWVELERICALPEVVAVGEAGLDYFYNHSPKAEQREAFARQCQLAKQLKKPLVVHVRDAHDECLDILRAEGMNRGVIHCFIGDTEAARRYLDLGFYLSISGVVTYKKNEFLQDAVAWAPLDRLMVETDTPFLAPVPNRGKRNELGFVAHTARKVAELKGISDDDAGRITARNASEFFGLNLSLPA